jgi:hypothetical protein
MRLIKLGIVLVLSCAVALPAFAAGKLTLDDVIARHLQSIGTPAARAAVKSRVAQGTTRFEFVTGGAGKMDGKTTLVSQENNSRLVMRFGNVDYQGEDLLTNGDRVDVRGTPNRSTFGTFLYTQNALIREGLFEGQLSTAWPFLDPKVRGAKLTYNGLKTIDGHDAHEVKYVPRKSTDLEIRVYFDSETFRHVATVTSVNLDPRLVGDVLNSTDFMGRGTPGDNDRLTAQARQQPVRFKIEQRFSVFREVDGVTVPMESLLRFTIEGQTSSVRTYNSKFDQVTNNVSLDPKNFQFK